LLKIKDKSGKIKYILTDSDEEPVSIDEFILSDKNNNNKEDEECKKTQKNKK